VERLAAERGVVHVLQQLLERTGPLRGKLPAAFGPAVRSDHGPSVPAAAAAVVVAAVVAVVVAVVVAAPCVLGVMDAGGGGAMVGAGAPRMRRCATGHKASSATAGSSGCVGPGARLPRRSVSCTSGRVHSAVSSGGRREETAPQLLVLQGLAGRRPRRGQASKR